MSRSFAISDIHGCAETFRALIQNIIKLAVEDKLFLLGDYIDRGPDSKGVIDYILELQQAGHQITCLKGNHEELMLRGISDLKHREIWLANGGQDALKSFGITQLEEMNEIYMNFFRNLKSYAVTDGYIMVHAGLDFSRDNIFENEESMLWLRNFDVDPKKTGNRIILHGHTPTSFSNIQLMVMEADKKFRINIDNGCVFDRGPGYGNLCALELISGRIYLQKRLD